MEELIRQLEEMLARMSKPELLEAEEVGLMADRWREVVGLLEKTGYAGLDPAAKLNMRLRLRKLTLALPGVMSLLDAQKSAIANRLFSENKRLGYMKAQRRGLGQEEHLVQRKA
ncbi:MAG: hypothetical protein HQL56_03125 [Magnetococcales bacterium]|nr:hypothetical protein [Magnetococcales bacterium]